MMELFTDGAARGNPGISGIGFVFIEDGVVAKEGSYYIGERTNNEAEYLALIKALEEAKDYYKLDIRSDSELMVNQIKGTYKIKNTNLKRLHNKVKELLVSHNYFIRLVPREDNKKADKLANKAIDDYLEGKTKEHNFEGIAEQNSLF